MPGYIGFQLSLELTKLLPSGLVTAGVTQLVNFARELRTSGSDIVIEEDLATIFGRGRISPEIERTFKEEVNIQKYTPLCHGSDLDLAEGMGPTMMRAFQERKYFATVLTLSMLSYFYSPHTLARMISKSIAVRFEAKVPGASADPGFDGIMNTLMACSSQTATFNWATYRERVEAKLQNFIPSYFYREDYIQLSPAVMTGAMDFLYLAQSLPEDRKITVPYQRGCIILVIWAHFILGLSVVINAPGKVQIVFGNLEDAQVYITWSEDYDNQTNYYDSGPEMRLHDKDMSVILSCEPQPGDELVISRGVKERHPLNGYGLTQLRRSINEDVIIPDTHPIYKESFNLVLGYAMHAARRMDRVLELGVHTHNLGPSSHGTPMVLEAWRIANSARMLFHGMDVDPTTVTSYTEFFSQNPLNEESLPVAITAFCKKTGQPAAAAKFLDMAKYLIRLVLVFAHVYELDKCGELPLILTTDYGAYWTQLDKISKDFETRCLVDPSTPFLGVASLLADSEAVPQNDHRTTGYRAQFLISGYGWSVFFDTAGFPDPGKCRPELLHVRRGTPTNQKTKERKYSICDGTGFTNTSSPGLQDREIGVSYTPRAVARVTGYTEYWSPQPRDFELSLFLHVEPIADWEGYKPYEDMVTYRNMIDCLWVSYTTPACDHDINTRTSTQQAPTKLRPDSAALIGWTIWPEPDENGNEDYGPTPHRILICATFGQPGVRWLALQSADLKRHNEEREIMLRTESCCAECALEHTALQEGRWFLIL
jgi:hypothetical protein